MRPRLSCLRIGRIFGSLAILSAALTVTHASAAGIGEPNSSQQRWAFTPLISFSNLSDGRSDWKEADLGLLYRARPDLVLGGGADIRRRFGRTDTLYSLSVSYLPDPSMEWHGAFAVTPDADFSALQHYTAGLEWRALKDASFLFDYERLNFREGAINEYRPGLRYWFSDTTYITARYTDGRAFGQRDFDGYSLNLNLGLAEERRIVVGFAHGSDPEKDPGVPGVILTNADSYSVYYHHPLHNGLELIVGAEYEDRSGYYSRSTFTLGFSHRF